MGRFRIVMYFNTLSNDRKVLLLTTVLLIFTNLFILLDVPILRLVFGILFYSTIPGALILGILNLGNSRTIVMFILSWGLSISFIIFSGLFLNYLYPLFGYNAPLSTNSVVISFDIIILILIGAIILRNNSNFFIDLPDFNIDTMEKIYLLLPGFFPLFGILGIYIMNAKDNNVILMALHLLIVAYVIFMSLNHNRVSDRVYAPLLFLISITLVLLLGLRSNHIIGADVHAEYYVFQQTVQNGQWGIILNSTLDACLSISILPTVYQSLLGIDPPYIFNVLYPILFSVCPLVIYVISSKYIKCNYAFLASTFFISQNSFLWTAAGPRSRIAVLFFALAVMVLFSDDLDEKCKKLLFIIFASSCIVSHYSTTYIFFFLLLGMFLGIQIIRWMSLSEKRPINYKYQMNEYSVSCSLLKPHFTSGMLVLLFVAIFLWYSQITGVAFDPGVKFVERSILSLHDLFVLESRHDEVQAILGKGLESKGIAQWIEFIVVWIAIAFIAIGVLTTLARYRQCVSLDDTLNKEFHSNLLYRRLDAEFFTVSVICCAFLVVSIAMPYVLIGYGIQRTFFQMMVVLSLFFVIGGITIAELLHFPRRGHLLVLFVLITFFMSITGVTYQIFDDSRSMIFNSDIDTFDVFYIYDEEIFGALWLKKFSNETIKIYSDNLGERRLVSQGGLIRVPVYAPSIVEILKASHGSLEDGYIYLRHTAIIDGKLLDQNYMWHNISDYQNEILTRNLIYSNNGSQVWL